MFLIVVFTCFCIASIINFFKTRRQRALITNIKGPRTLPLTGAAHKFCLLKPENFFKKSALYIEEYGPLSRCWAFHRLFILTCDYEFVEQLLSHAEYQNTGYNLLKPWLGSGLLMSDGLEWMQKRQLMAHAFQTEHIFEEYIHVFVEQTNILNERLRVECNTGKCFDIYNYVWKAVLDIMIATSLGIKGLAQYEMCSEYAKSTMDLTTIFTERFLCLHSVNNILFTMMCPRIKKRQRKLIENINRINNETIEERRDKHKNHNKPKNNEIFTIQIRCHPTEDVAQLNNEAHEKCKTFLDILLESNVAGVPLTNAEISDELNTFIFQGQLLTTSAICFGLTQIARNPHVQQKLVEEIAQVWQREKRKELQMEHLNQLKYLECVIKETLRLYPPQTIIGRELKENFAYTHSQVGDGVMPAGAEIYICLYDMLRNADKFEDADHFRPERFLNISTNANLLSFSMGPRNCLAQKFVMLLMKTFIVCLLSEYELLPYGDDVRLEVKIVMKSSNGFQLGLRPRH